MVKYLYAIQIIHLHSAVQIVFLYDADRVELESEGMPYCSSHTVFLPCEHRQAFISLGLGFPINKVGMMETSPIPLPLISEHLVRYIHMFKCKPLCLFLLWTALLLGDTQLYIITA